MKEQFVSYEIAKRMKELGFVGLTNHFYSQQGKLIPRILESGNEPVSFEPDDFYENFNTIVKYEVNGKYQHVTSAPSWQQAIDWLEARGLSVCIFPVYRGEKIAFFKVNMTHFNEEIDTNELFGNFNDTFNTKYEALNRAIEESLNIVSKEKFKDGGSVKKEKNNKMGKDTFTEIADYGDQKFFIRDFGSTDIEVDGEDKEIPLVLVAEIMDYYEATGEDEYKDKPFVIMVSIYPEMEYIDKKHIESAAESGSIETDEVQYTDISSYMGGIPVIQDDLNRQYAEMEEAEEFLLSDKLKKELNAKQLMIGFYLDGAINRMGNSRWSFLEYMVNAEKNFYRQ